MIMLGVILSNVGGICRSIRSSVIGASEDTIDTILIQNIGIEEYADSGGRDRGGMLEVIGRLLLAGRGADRRVIGLILRESLHAHVGAGGGGCVDRCVVQEGGTGPSREWLGSGGISAGRLDISYFPLSRSGRLGNILGTSLDDVESSLILSHVGGISGRKSGAEERALNASHGGRIWAASGSIWNDRCITLKDYSSSALTSQNIFM
jgi:hypothetical protein